jgi:hypothetical protein
MSDVLIQIIFWIQIIQKFDYIAHKEYIKGALEREILGSLSAPNDYAADPASGKFFYCGSMWIRIQNIGEDSLPYWR